MPENFGSIRVTSKCLVWHHFDSQKPKARSEVNLFHWNRIQSSPLISVQMANGKPHFIFDYGLCCFVCLFVCLLLIKMSMQSNLHLAKSIRNSSLAVQCIVKAILLELKMFAVVQDWDTQNKLSLSINVRWLNKAFCNIFFHFLWYPSSSISPCLLKIHKIITSSENQTRTENTFFACARGERVFDKQYQTRPTYYFSIFNEKIS